MHNEIVHVAEAEASLPELAREIQEASALHERATRDSLAHARRAGAALLQAKKCLGHGQWEGWLRDHARVPPRTARRYMRIAREWEALRAKSASLADLTMEEAERLLRGPGAPDDGLGPGLELVRNSLAYRVFVTHAFRFGAEEALASGFLRAEDRPGGAFHDGHRADLEHHGLLQEADDLAGGRPVAPGVRAMYRLGLKEAVERGGFLPPTGPAGSKGGDGSDAGMWHWFEGERVWARLLRLREKGRDAEEKFAAALRRQAQCLTRARDIARPGNYQKFVMYKLGLSLEEADRIIDAARADRPMIAYFEALLRSLPPEESEAWRKMIADFEALPPEGREAWMKSAAAGADED